MANPDTATVTALQHGLCSYRHSSANPATDGVAGMLLVACVVDRRTQLIFIFLCQLTNGGVLTVNWIFTGQCTLIQTSTGTQRYINGFNRHHCAIGAMRHSDGTSNSRRPVVDKLTSSDQLEIITQVKSSLKDWKYVERGGNAGNTEFARTLQN